MPQQPGRVAVDSDAGGEAVDLVGEVWQRGGDDITVGGDAWSQRVEVHRPVVEVAEAGERVVEKAAEPCGQRASVCEPTGARRAGQLKERHAVHAHGLIALPSRLSWSWSEGHS